MRAYLAVILTIIFPGTGHILLRRYLKGIVLGVLYAASADVFLTSKFMMPLLSATILPTISICLMGAIWVFAIIDLVIRLKSLRASDFQKTKDDLLRAAQVAWLKDDYPLAEQALRQILKSDERDVEAWVHLGKILKATGREKEARICFKSAVNLDGSAVWRWQLMEELNPTPPKPVEMKIS